MFWLFGVNEQAVKKQIEQLAKQMGFYPILEPLYNFPSVVRGAIIYYTQPKKQFIIIASAMRSGSTLLKALLAQAPEIEQLSEQRFQLPQNFFTVYGRLARLSKYPYILLKHPANFQDYQTYPILPKVPYKMIILVRNPLDTLISVRKMQEVQQEPKSVADLLHYWKVVHQRLVKLSGPNVRLIRYEDLVTQPESTTKELFAFIGSTLQEGVSTYKNPNKSHWEWGKDDGGEVIKKMEVQRLAKDYSHHLDLVEAIKQDPEMQALIQQLELELPTH